MRNFTFNQPKFFRLTLLIAFLLLVSYNASAQFYTKHYIAPAPWQYFSKANEIVIATNSTATVNITLSKSDGTLEANLTAIKGTPAVYRFKLNASTLPMNALTTVLNAAGLIITSTAPTSINLRNVASDDYSRGENADVNIKGNAALTSFGDAGLGVRFRVGYYRDGSLGSFSTFGDQRPIYSIMATVNNTSIKISNNVVTTLNAGQSYLFKAPIGTLVESSNPCVMNTSAAIDMPGGCGDGAFNQIPPEAVLGTEYFLERGTGNSIAEQTTVVATKDNTVVTVTGYTATGTLVTTNTVTLALAGDFYTFVNGSNGTSFTASRVVADKRVAVYSGTAQKCEVDVSTIAPVSECGGSNFIETAKFRDYASNTLDYFGYILLRSATDIVYVNGVSIESISGIAPRYQIGTTGWYLINFKNTQIGGPDFLSISSIAKLTVSIVQQDGGFSMAGFFSNFAAQPEDPTLTYISGGGCTNNKAELTTPAGFAPYQWYFNGTAITGANSSTYTATKTGSYSVSSTLACGAQTPSKPVSVTLCTDLGITKTVDNTTPCIGSNVEFTVKVSNLGGNNVSGISVNDLLPSGYTYVSSTPSVGAYDSGTGVWSIGDVDAGAVLTLKIIATVNSSGNYTNTASLPASVDTNTANNSASAAVNPKAPYLTVTNPAAVCATATIDLTAAAVTAGSTGNLTLSYWVNSSATTSYTTPTTATAGTYYIKATSAEGCVFIKPVVVTNNPLPSTPEIYVSKNSATCTTAGNTTLRSTDSATNYNGSTYLWSTGETTRTITINTEGTYSLKIISGSGCASSSSAPITVTFTPTAPSASAQTFCSSENKKVSDLSPSGSTIKWYDTSSSTSPLAGTTALTSKTYYVSQTSSSGCESARTAVVVTVNSTSSAPSASPQTFCAADNKKISDLSPSGSTIKWYDTSSSTSPLAGNTALTSKTYYVSQTANSCGESARTPVVVTISTVPSAPATSPQTFCINDSKKVSDLSPSGAGIKWYSAITGGTLYDGTETLTSKAYFVSQSNSCGESARTSVTVTVNNTAAPTASSQTFCAIDNKKVSDLSPSGASFKWYNASTGGTPYTGTETLSSTNYYVSQTINGCESSRTLVAVTVNNTAAPTASSQTFCAADNKKVNDLSPSGAGIKWYNASTGGTAYLGTETLSSANYYVSQTLNSCESARTLVSVTVNPTPDAPSIIAGGSTTFCPGGSVVLTSSGGSSYLWSTGETTQAITVSASGSYTVKVANATGCLSLASTATSVTVNPTPSAPSANAQSFCSVDNKKVSDLSPSGAGIKWYSANTGGTLYTGTEALTNGTYYVSQTTNGCESPRTSVAVTLTAKPADIVTNKTICSGESYTWSVNNTVYTTNQTALKIINNSCTADQILNLTVTPKPADIVTNKTICSGETYTWTVNGIDYTTNQTGLRIPHNGCTADEVLNLTITPKPSDIVTNKTICSGETYTWSANGIDYTSNQTGLRIPHDGCTADEVLNLTVTPKPSDIVTNKTICSGETYTWSANGIDYTSNQTGLRIPHDGCTADEVLNLSVTPKPSDIVTNKTICSGETYTWSANGIDYTSNQTGLRIPHDGCTADEVLNLTVTPKPADIVTNKTICSGENYTWSANGIDYTSNQTGLRIPHDGCTADEVLNLTVTPKPADIVTNKTICSGENYTWSANGIDYTSNQTGLRIPHDGCTADEVLNLTVTPKPADIVTNKTICSGETYTWSANGIDYTTNQTGLRIPHDGCTADEVLNLTITPKPSDIVTNKTICSGETYTWSANGIDYTTNQTGLRIPHNGCTADEVLNLTVTPKSSDIVTNKTICSGETYTWTVNGIDYTTNQTGLRIPHNGCTADEVLNLTVTPKPLDVVTNKTICSGETYTWTANGTDYTSNQTGLRISHDGCTADEVLNLTVTPKPSDIVTNKTICSGETYNWLANGIDYTSNQTGLRISHDGCTADEVLNLTVTPKPSDIVTNKTICSGETYTWTVNGIDYTSNQTGLRIPHDGCTADEVLNLTITPKPSDIVTNKTICSGETYTWSANGIDYTTNQTGLRIPHDGCTADEVLNLSVTPKPSDIVTNKTICSGETYTWSANGIDYTSNQTGLRISHDGCTADEVLNLTVTPKPADVVTNKTICSGETYTWSANGIDYTTNQTGLRIPHNGCTADEVLNLTVTPKPADVVTNKTICSGETYTWSANGIDYTSNQNGLRIPHDGCTADEVLNLTVTPKPSDIVTNKTICSGETYTWTVNGIDYTSNQTGLRISHDGCTADEVLNLTITPKPTDVVTNKTICSGETYTWAANGIDYTSNQTGLRIPHDGCTADEVLNLTVTPKPIDIVTNKMICSGETYTWTANGTDYASNQTGLRISHDGCTADEVLNLTVTPKPSDVVTNKTICSGETYTWTANGIDYTSNQTGLRISHNGCTADEVLNLTVTPKPSDIVTNKTICSGETYTWTVNGIDYTSNQTGLRISHDGCTADEVLNLTVTPKPSDIVTNKTICSGETYTWAANGIDYTSNQTGLRIPHNGCTADEVLNLTVTPKPVDIVTNKTICSGETYTWSANGIDYTSNQTGLRIPHDGCTADEVLNLTVTPKPADIVTNKTICSGETYTWNANGIDYASNQTGLRISHDGCTADEVLNLTVTPKPTDVVTNKTICSGETYTWSANGIDYTSNQTGLRISHDGCTVDEVLNLTVTPKPSDVVTNKTICSGETYTWTANGTDYASNQTGLRISHDGCTADEVLNLTVAPKPSDVVTNKTICSGETYTWTANGIDYTSNQTGLRIPHDGCTADEVLNLTITPKPTDVVTNKTICSGETYNWSANGINYTTNQNGLRIPHDGCTADEVLNLTVTPKPIDIVTNKTICSGETYTWTVNGIDYTSNQTGLRISHDGCTADEVLNLTVTAKPADVVTNKTICSGETYTWSANGIDYTSNQTGLRIPHDGCTADEVLNLTVTPKPSDVVTNKTICSGETYTWLANGIDYTSNQTGLRIPHDGCTADEVLNLTVTPKPSDIVTNKTICSGETYTWTANGINYTSNQTGLRIPHDGCTADEVLNLTVTPKPSDIVTNKTICSGETYTWSANGIDYTSNQIGLRIPHDGCTADEVLNLVVNTISKPIVSIINQPTCSSSVASVELSNLPTGTWTINPGNISGNTTTTTISGLLPGNTYNYTVTNSLGCESLASSNIVILDFICAEDDTPSAINGATGGTISTIFANDKINGSSFLPTDVSVSTTTLPTGFTFNSDGTIVIAPNTVAGTYTITYTICKSTNLSICDSATIEVIITAPVIDAVPETTASINGSIGGKTASLITNDTLNGAAAVIGNQPGQVILTGITVPAGLTLNADGTVSVAAGTPIGNYEVEYRICEVNNTNNCDIAKSIIPVTGAVLVLVDDSASSVVGTNQPQTVLNVLGNDTKNGQPIVSTEVSISETVSDPTGSIKLNPDGTIVLKENTPAGTYELTYQVCELNTTNCATATVTISVVAPTMTITADSYCSNNVPYVSYKVTPDNFTPNNLLTIRWIDSANNVVATQTNLPLSGDILWPGAAIDSNGNGMDWPGWLLSNGQWTEGADGFENTRPSVTMEFSLSPTASVVVNYPAATAGCNAKPSFTIKANDDEAGPINTNKEISTSLNIFNNDTLNGGTLSAANVVLTTIIPNPNLVLNADGSVDLKPKTPSGTYQLTYQICDALNTSSCSQAIVTITVLNSLDPDPPVIPRVIIALTNDTATVDGINGELEFINVLDNDLLKGLPINIADIDFSSTSNSPYFEFNSDGTVNVKPNTPGGDYALTYQVCEKGNPNNCSTATLNVFVEVPSVAIIKTASFNDENGDGVAEAGETITYKFKVTNTGNVALTQVMVTDPLPGVVISGQAIDLELNESNETNFTAEYKITQNDINHGSVTNQASVEGRSRKGVVVSDTSDKENNAEDRPTVLVLNGCEIKVFSAFSPNGDTKNSRFYIQGLECYPDNTVEIYNRWGVLVYDTDHYNNQDRVFVGVSQGRATVKQSDGLPAGTYFYTLKYRDSGSNQHELSGYLYLNK